VGGVCKVFFSEEEKNFLSSKKKKKIVSPYIIPYFLPLVKRFLQKTFFIFREIFLDLGEKNML
jgi:hypothetical protein